MSFIIGDFGHRATVFNSAETPLSSLRGLALVDRGDRYFIQGADYTNFVALELSLDGQLSPLPASLYTEVGSFNTGIEAFTFEGDDFVAVSRVTGLGVRRVEDDGSFTEVAFAGGGDLNLFFNITHPAIVEIGGNSIIVGSGFSSDGISIFVWDRDLELKNIDNIDDADDALNALDEVSRLHAFEAAGTHDVAAASSLEAAVTLFSINAAAELTTVSRADASAQFPLTSVGGMTSATVGGQTFLFVSTPSDNAITALRVGASGTLTPGRLCPGRDDVGSRRGHGRH